MFRFKRKLGAATQGKAAIAKLALLDLSCGSGASRWGSVYQVVRVGRGTRRFPVVALAGADLRL
jgi:hypothetical protein